MKTVYYQHLYLTSGFDVSNKLIDGKLYKAKRTHACLHFGHWCWKNALENPLMAIKFIIWKLKK